MLNQQRYLGCALVLRCKAQGRRARAGLGGREGTSCPETRGRRGAVGFKPAGYFLCLTPPPPSESFPPFANSQILFPIPIPDFSFMSHLPLSRTLQKYMHLSVLTHGLTSEFMGWCLVVLLPVVCSSIFLSPNIIQG